MAPLTFPNEKQMVSKEESALHRAGRWWEWDELLGGSGGQRVGSGGLLPHMRGRGKNTKSFPRLGFHLFYSLMRGRRGGEHALPFETAGCGRGWDGLGALGAKLPPGPAPPAPPRAQTPGHGPAAGPTRSASPPGGSPISRSLPPLRFGAISLQRAGGRGALLGWKFPADRLLENKRILRSRNQRAGIYCRPPSIFSKRNHPNLRQNTADIFAVLCISFFNECGNRRHRDYFFFYEGKNLIFRDFVGGVSRPRLPVAERRGEGSLPVPAVAVPRR